MPAHLTYCTIPMKLISLETQGRFDSTKWVYTYLHSRCHFMVSVSLVYWSILWSNYLLAFLTWKCNKDISTSHAGYAAAFVALSTTCSTQIFAHLRFPPAFINSSKQYKLCGFGYYEISLTLIERDLFQRLASIITYHQIIDRGTIKPKLSMISMDRSLNTFPRTPCGHIKNANYYLSDGVANREFTFLSLCLHMEIRSTGPNELI